MLPSTHVEPGTVIQAGHPGAVRAASFESVVRPDVMAWKHHMLIMNLRNPVQACCGAPGEDADRLGALAVAEGEHVLEVAGIEVVSHAVDHERCGDLLDTSAMRIRGGGSTWQSLRRGAGSVESDHLNGEISLLGRLHGLLSGLGG